MLYWEKIPEHIIRQIKTSSILGMLTPLGEGRFVIVGGHERIHYVLLSETPHEGLMFETYEAFGKKFPGMLTITRRKDPYLLPFSKTRSRFAHIDRAGWIETKDFIGGKQEIIDMMEPYLSGDQNDENFDSLLSVLNRGSVAAAPWRLPDLKYKAPMRRLKKPRKPVHGIVDVEKWIETFPLEPEREKARRFVEKCAGESPENYENRAAVERHIRLMSPGREAITSPYHLAVMEQLRRENPPEGRGFEALPCDVFVYHQGEPGDRRVTKVGGLPYWPINREWPDNRDGRPLVFIGQFNFLDSAENVGPLPGDVLLVFADESIADHGFTPFEKDDLQFFWQDVHADVKLTPKENIPKAAWRLSPFYGDLHRTTDFRESDELLIMEDAERIRDLLVWEGSKIGGEPYWLQEPGCIGARFLCSLGSINPKNDIAHPFLNIRTPIIYPEKEEEFEDFIKQREFLTGMMMWGDGGSLHVFIDEEGEICHTVQSY
ncbi:MAG: DUF1963 domain-containing protein [Desulfobacterales bacterium]|nr:DUF1963 domain-containing protein [Desulfobacterales bacterium]